MMNNWNYANCANEWDIPRFAMTAAEYADYQASVLDSHRDPYAGFEIDVIPPSEEEMEAMFAAYSIS